MWKSGLQKSMGPKKWSLGPPEILMGPWSWLTQPLRANLTLYKLSIKLARHWLVYPKGPQPLGRDPLLGRKKVATGSRKGSVKMAANCTS